MTDIEATGKDIAEAIENGLKKTKLHRDQVEVTVLEEGASGFLGIGTKRARVVLREKKWSSPEDLSPPEPAEAPAKTKDAVNTSLYVETAQNVVREILTLMDLGQARLEAVWQDRQNRVCIRIETTEGKLLIGKEGQTLASLQFLVTLIVNRKLGSAIAVQIDTLGYWQKRESRVLERLPRAVDEVKRTGKAIGLEPMDSYLRRLVHKTLKNSPDVDTISEGEGVFRKVTLRPKPKRR
ncbi:MAG: Jag N-terminal domain-containing protein [Elusimicrobia bacterium]|nr:Jag N-terminal domain-containing protein [Elusimicrobiota bacterium]